MLQVYRPPFGPDGFAGGHEAPPVCGGEPRHRVRHGHEPILGEFTLGKADCRDLLLRETTAIEDVDQSSASRITAAAAMGQLARK